jgi:tRNA1(Val) A37 N6-methylase TrmN6
MKDLFGIEIIKEPLLRDKFIEPPFSVLDSKQGNWRNRVNKWRSLGIKSDIGRNAIIKGTTNMTRLMKDKSKVKGHKVHEGISIFDPALAEVIYHWFCPEGGRILDPFAGGSVRGIVANYMGYKYTGIDLRQEQINSNIQQSLNILPINNQPIWIVGDSNIILNNKSLGEFDLIFSCPPYFDLEKYSNLPNDLSNMNYTNFIITYKSIIKKAVKHLKTGGYVCFVISEIRDNKGYYRSFVPDTIEAMIEAGLKYYNEIIYLNGLAGACLTAGRIMEISKKVKKIHQNVLVFIKVN